MQFCSSIQPQKASFLYHLLFSPDRGAVLLSPGELSNRLYQQLQGGFFPPAAGFKSRLGQTFSHCNEPSKDQAHCLDFLDKTVQPTTRPSTFTDPLCPSRPTAPESLISPSKGKKPAAVNHKSPNGILRSWVTLLSIQFR